MKTAEEKLGFKNHFFKLGQGRIISLEDDYWESFWKTPTSTNDIFELLTPYDIQCIRDQNRTNFLLLIYKLFVEVIQYSQYNRPLESTHLLNCIRFLIKIVPFLFEMEDYKNIETRIFCATEYEPLVFSQGNDIQGSKGINQDSFSNKIIQALVRLLYFKGFTLTPSRVSKQSNGEMVCYSVWEPGVGITSKYQPPDLIIESNRTLVLKLILTLSGVSMYQYPSQVIGNGSLFVTLLVSSLSKLEILTLVCSLINVLCRSARNSPDERMLLLNDPTLKFLRYLYVNHCVQLLTLLIVYPLPARSDLDHLIKANILDKKPYNMARLYFGRLHKELELLFLTSSLVNRLRSPIFDGEGSFDLNMNRYATSPIWAIECIMLLWELFQCNPKFKEVCGAQFYSEICFILVFYIKSYSPNTRDRNLVRLAACFLLYLSYQKPLSEELLYVRPKFLNDFPTHLNFNQAHDMSTRDFLVSQISSILNNYTSPKQFYPVNPLLATSLIEILYNLIPLLSTEHTNGTDDPAKKLHNINPRNGLSYSACTSLTNLLVRFSNRDFLLKTSFNPDLLALLTRSICTVALKDTKASRMLLFSILKNEKIYDQIWNTIDSFENEYFEEDRLIMKPVDIDEPEPETGTTVESEVNTAESTPLNRSTSNLTINEEDPILQPNVQRKFSSFTNETQSINSDLEQQDPDDYEAEIKAIDKALRPSLPTGMSSKAIGKQKKEASIRKTWAGNDALRIILTIIIPHLKLVLNETWLEENSGNIEAFRLVQYIGDSDFSALIEENRKKINQDFLPSTPVVLLKFSWTSISLGWYISLIYSEIYNGIDNVEIATGGRNKIIKNLTSSVLSFGRFFQGANKEPNAVIETPEVISEVENSVTKINHWAQTSIKLFKIKAESSFFDVLNSKIIGMQNQATPSTPSMDRPASLARRLSDLRLQQIKSSTPVSGLNTPIEEPEGYFPNTRNARGSSVSSLYSLNTLNRSRTNTPRNSISN